MVVPNSGLAVPNSGLAVPNSGLAAFNSDLVVLNSDEAAFNSDSILLNPNIANWKDLQTEKHTHYYSNHKSPIPVRGMGLTGGGVFY